MDRIIIVNGVPYICHKAYDMEVLNPNKKGKFIIPGNLTKICSPYDHKNICIQYKECDNKEAHFFYSDNDIFRDFCIFTGIDIATGEKWVMTRYHNWYKEYTKVFSDETEVETYNNKYRNCKGIIEYHFCKTSLVSAKGYDGKRISVVTSIIGRDVTTGANMVYEAGNWYEMLDDETRDLTKIDKIPPKVKYKSIYDDSIDTFRTIIECKYLEQPTKMTVKLKNGGEAICIPEYIGRDEETFDLLAYFNGNWYLVKDNSGEILHTIKNDAMKLIEKYEKDQKEKSNDLKTCTFTSIYDGRSVTVKYADIPKVVAIEVFYDKTRKMIVFPTLIGVEVNSNNNQIWVSYLKYWYKACGDPKEILKYVEETLRNRINDFNKEESKDLDLFNKECVIPNGQMIENLKNETIEDFTILDYINRIKPVMKDSEGKVDIVNPYSKSTITIEYTKYTDDKPIKVYDSRLPDEPYKYKEFVPDYIGWDTNGIKWASLDGKWYLVDNISNKKNTTKNVTATAKVQKLDATDKNQRAWHVKSIKNREDKKYIFPVKNIIANMAKWIYSQDPINHNNSYPVHKDYISEILHLLYMNMIKDGCRIENPADETFYYFEYTKEELRKYLSYQVYMDHASKEVFSRLNLSYNEMKKGIEVSDPNRDTISLSSRFSGPKWEDDFIDLDALINNVVLECVKDAVAVE